VEVTKQETSTTGKSQKFSPSPADELSPQGFLEGGGDKDSEKRETLAVEGITITSRGIVGRRFC